MLNSNTCVPSSVSTFWNSISSGKFCLGTAMTAARVVLFPDIPIATRLITLLQLIIYSGMVILPWSSVPPAGISNDFFRMPKSPKKWLRFFSSPYEHCYDTQFYVNMTVFIYLGQQLERHYGFIRFPILVAILGALTNAVYISLMQMLGYCSSGVGLHYASGFTGVLFALQDILIHRPDYAPNPILFFGLRGDRLAQMSELMLLSTQIPGYNLYYNVAGVIAGIIFRKAFGRAPVAAAPAN